MPVQGKQKRIWAAALLLAALLLAAGCGGEFWGSVGDWEPGELGQVPAPALPAGPGPGHRGC
jgi:hypothetical protein